MIFEVGDSVDTGIALGETLGDVLGEVLGCIEGVANGAFAGVAVIILNVGCWVTMFDVGVSVTTAVDGLGVALDESSVGADGGSPLMICIVGASVGPVTVFEAGALVLMDGVSMTGQSNVSGIAGQAQSQLDAGESEKQQSGTPFFAVAHSVFTCNGANPDDFLL
jgi:hypothetical protein